MDNKIAVDPVETMIRESGWLQDPDLWRQWIFTQMIRTCQARDLDAFKEKFLSARPYAYQWDTAIREIKMRVKANPSESAERPLFFTFSVLLRMVSDYMSALDAFAANPRRQRRDGNGTYFSVKGERIYLSASSGRKSGETYRKRAEKALSGLRRAQSSGSCRFALKTIEAFKSTALLSANLPKSDAWMAAFAANGAYYTMDNLIRFHGCRFLGRDGRPSSLEASLRRLASSARTLGAEPEAMFDMMSALLDENPETRDALAGNQEKEAYD